MALHRPDLNLTSRTHMRHAVARTGTLLIAFILVIALLAALGQFWPTGPEEGAPRAPTRDMVE